MNRLIVVFLLIILSQSGLCQNQPPKREMRAVWIASISNIDWPSSKYLSSKRKIDELKELFDKLKDAGINAVFFQIRTECDALYDSPYEPWSEWLTGEQGIAPDPYFDPLKLAIKEAHKRGMELHAWMNPLRVSNNVTVRDCSDNHICKLHPEWILNVANYKLLNPGIPEVREYVAKIAADVVRRYAVDGVNFDDYFYPYSPRISKQDLESFGKFGKNSKTLADWRRENIDKLVELVSDSIHTVKPKVKFGVSPFGIVKNGFAGTSGLGSYSSTYSNPLSWLKNKTIDYVVPQLYWPIGNKDADYSKLLKWWASIVGKQHLYIGQTLSFSKNLKSSTVGNEITNQIKLNRKFNSVKGSVFFSANVFVNKVSNNQQPFAKRIFSEKALVPAMTDKDSIPPEAPENLKILNGSGYIELTWEKSVVAADGDTAKFYVLYGFDDKNDLNFNNPENIIDIVSGNETEYKIYINRKYSNKKYFAVTSLDELNVESIDNSMVQYFANSIKNEQANEEKLNISKADSKSSLHSPKTVTNSFLAPP